MGVFKDRLHARIQEFSSGGGGGGGQVSLTKKNSDNVVFLVLSLFYRRQMVNFKEIYHFQGSRWGLAFSRGGGVQLFPGGSNCLFAIETHITCDFPGGPDPLYPTLDPHLRLGKMLVSKIH